jgi:hypothetical protein
MSGLPLPEGPGRLLWNAIVEPLGDHAGSMSNFPSGGAVMAFCPEPSAFMTQIARSPDEQVVGSCDLAT